MALQGRSPVAQSPPGCLLSHPAPSCLRPEDLMSHFHLEGGDPEGQGATLRLSHKAMQLRSRCTQGNLPARRGTQPHLIFLELAQRPHGTQVPAGAASVWQCVHNLLNGDHPLCRGWWGPHGWGGIGDPGTPVVLQGEPQTGNAAAATHVSRLPPVHTPIPTGPGSQTAAPSLLLCPVGPSAKRAEP